MNKERFEKWLLNNPTITADEQELIIEVLDDYFEQQDNSQKLLDSAISSLIEVCDNWDNEAIVTYPQTLPSFDDLILDLKKIKFKESEGWE